MHVGKEFLYTPQLFMWVVPKLLKSSLLGTSPTKKTGNSGNFEKTGGGGSTRIPLPFFTVFNMGDPPKKGPKMQKKP